MDKNLEKRTQNSSQIAWTVPQGMAKRAPIVAGSPAGGLGHAREHSALRFPPTRAARAPGGRGGLLAGDKGMGAGRSRWIEAPLAILALAIAAFALAVCVNAPSIVAGASFGTNPG